MTTQITRDNHIYNQTLVTDTNGNPVDKDGKLTKNSKSFVYTNNDHQYPIVYCFDSKEGNVPQKVVDALAIDALAKKGVTVMSSPPDKVYQPSQSVQKPVNSNNPVNK